MEQYYRTGKYADLEMVILSGGFEDHINVHRVVVCRKSAVLEAYDEMAAKTENPGTITITEPEMQTFLKMIEWMYGIDRDGLLRNNAHRRYGRRGPARHGKQNPFCRRSGVHRR